MLPSDDSTAARLRCGRQAVHAPRVPAFRRLAQPKAILLNIAPASSRRS
jgi:hypothetical protein